MSNSAIYDITNEPILKRANEQYCTSPNLGCPVTLINRLIGTTNGLPDRKLKGDIIRYTFVSGDLPLERNYQIIAQLRNPDDRCSNPNGSIISAVPIAESVNYFKYTSSTSQVNLARTKKPSGPEIPQTNLDSQLPSDCIILQDNHPRETKLKIVIVGASYGAVNKELFLRAANRIKDQILSFEPFRSNSNKINFYALNSENDFGCHFGCHNIQRALCCSRNFEISDFVASRCPFNKIMLVFNSYEHGGTGGSIPVTAMGSIDVNTPIHEFGHSFGGLVDEYNYNHGLIPYSETDVNCDNNPQCPKWQDLMGRYENEVTKNVVTVGCFEGCKYQERGLYRPIEIESIMLDMLGDFGPVNERHLRRLLEHYT